MTRVFTQKLDEDVVLGVIEYAEVLEVPPQGATDSAAVNRLDSSSDHEGRTS